MKPLSIRRIGFLLALMWSGAKALPSHAQNPVAVSPNALGQLQISAQSLSAHQLKTPNLVGVKSFEFSGARFTTLPLAVQAKTPKLDTLTFLNNVDKALQGRVTGYAMQIQRGAIGIGKPKLLVKRGASRRANDGDRAWDADTRMHVASVSKLLTAMGVAVALQERGLSYDTKISPYLPAYWAQGPNIDKITFRHLLTQTSGFKTSLSDSDYGFMRDMVKQGVAGVGSYDYENMNFGICRVLLPILLGQVSKNMQMPAMFPSSMKDRYWDLITLTRFKSYMQQKVFSPSGVSNVGFSHPAGEQTALAYNFPASGNGWDSGDVAGWAGGAGFRLSTRELLDVMATWADTDAILPRAKTKECLDNGFGLDVVADSTAGRLYSKNGAWQNGQGQREQCVAYFLPGNLQFVLYVNSPVGQNDQFLRGLVDKAFADSVK